jgi:sigma-B regulation protein RsbU (phosphoserine phosphatase)
MLRFRISRTPTFARARDHIPDLEDGGILFLSFARVLLMSSLDSIAVAVWQHLADLLLGPVFLFVGSAACAVAAIRRRGDVGPLVWFGIFIGLYGIRMLANLCSVFHLFGESELPARLVIGVDYVVVIPALLFWTDLSRGVFRRAYQILALLAAMFAVLGVSRYAMGGSPFTVLRLNEAIAVLSMITLGFIMAVRPLAQKYLVVQSRALRLALPAMALVVVYVNVMWFFAIPPASYIEPIGFAVWIGIIGHEAAVHTFANERRLLSIESELETARQIQQSILPHSVPDSRGLRIAACYQPMSAVAGDFYQFVKVGEHGLGVLVADVTGHGVPAALIASMLKIAMQSAVGSAAEPSLLLKNLNRILTPELAGRLTSAGYLWLDTASGHARYSAAGHPPLLHWRPSTGEIRRIESNGILLGVVKDCDYPELEMAIAPGDRFLLYTDGLAEPENAAGEAFGEHEFERVLRESSALTASGLSAELLNALRKWQPRGAEQQDDITLIVIDAA